MRDYTIQQVLGHGGFGIVYKAHHNELDHFVAVKEYLPSELAVRNGTNVHPKSADCETHFAEGLRRFRDEAKALIEFQQHPNIVDCRDFFRANGTAYLVMEHLDGLPLSELLRQREDAGKPFTERDLLDLAVPLAQGLAHIHRAEVIHRDIKPANILVRRIDQQPVLIDFGAAKQVVAEHSRSLAPYTEGFAALEQVADGQLGPWTDLYGYGAVLWRIVAGGNRPWEPPNPVKVESRASARLREVDDPLPAATVLGAGRFSEQLLEMIDSCLRVSETERPTSSGRVVQLLQAIDEKHGASTSAPPRAVGGAEADLAESEPLGSQSTRSPNGRLRKIVGLAAATAVATALATAVLVSRHEPSEPWKGSSFSVEAEPATATVALLNEQEPYRPGMLLVPGQYEVRVSAPGFTTRREWVTHSESPSLYRFVLEPLAEADPEPASRNPPDATEQVADSSVADGGQMPSDLSAATEPLEGGPAVATNQGGADNVIDLEVDTTAEPELVQAGPEATEEPIDPTALESGLANDDSPITDTDLTDPIALDPEQLSSNITNPSEQIAEDPDTSINLGGTDTVEKPQFTCGADGGASCFELGEAHQKGDGRPRNPTQAAHYFRLACNGENAEGCGRLGQMYFNGEGVGQDRTRAAELYRQACDGGVAWGCNRLGQAYFIGEGVSQDRARAAELYRKSCDGGDAEGCGNLGYSYAEGEGVRRDRARAAGLHQKACDAGVAVGCGNLGNSYLKGWGVRRDRARAAELYQQACDGGAAWGCKNLGTSYLRGWGVRRDPARANQLYHQACEDGVMTACAALAENYLAGIGVEKDSFVAASLFATACEGGYEGSYGGEYIFWLGLGPVGVQSTCKVARTLLVQSCKKGHAASCKKLQALDPP